MHGHWQLQEAKQRFSELIRSVEVDGPQFVTRHGEEVAVVIDIAEYRREAANLVALGGSASSVSRKNGRPPNGVSLTPAS